MWKICHVSHNTTSLVREKNNRYVGYRGLFWHDQIEIFENNELNVQFQ